MKLKITIFFIAFISTISVAQTKIGTIDSEFIVGLMPETQIVLKRSQAYGAKLDSLFAIKTKKYSTKLKNYQDKQKTLSDLLRKTLLSELEELDKEIRKYRVNGNKLMQLKQNELMRPLYKKLGNAIKEVAKQNGYTQVLTTTGNQFVYLDDKFDITKLVMNKLGIKESVTEK